MSGVKQIPKVKVVSIYCGCTVSEIIIISTLLCRSFVIYFSYLQVFMWYLSFYPRVFITGREIAQVQSFDFFLKMLEVLFLASVASTNTPGTKEIHFSNPLAASLKARRCSRGHSSNCQSASARSRRCHVKQNSALMQCTELVMSMWYLSPLIKKELVWK